MKRLPPKLRDGLIFLGLLITVPCFIYYISMNFGDQRVHIEKKQWNPAEAADEGIDPQLLKEAADYIETRLPMARGMVIIKNGKTVHEKYYWKGGPQEKEYLHSLNGPILHALVGIAIDRKLLTGPDQSLEDFFPDYFRSGPGKDGVSPTVADLLQVKAPLLWGEKTAEYWKLFFGGNRIEAAIRTLFPAVTPPSPAAAFAAHYLLAEVLQQASSMSVFAFAHQHLFAPLGITTVAETKKTDGLLNPFTGFQLRTLDLAKFGYLVMHNGMWQKNRIIPAAWTRTITGISATPPGGGFWGGWHSASFIGRNVVMAAGESGQYLVLAPELDLLIAVSSKSRFPLAQNSGYEQLFRLVLAAAAPPPSRQTAADPEERPYYEPNFVVATPVPEEIREFFRAFASDIATGDINRILYHYAMGYENRDEDYRSMYGYWKKIFYGGSGELEFVQIEKLRIDNNRAYLRGSLKYSYANMNEGSIGWFPLESLIKLRGRWLWFGSPAYGAILDRDAYFDAAVSPEMTDFISRCGPALTTPAGRDNSACFSENFRYNGMAPRQLQELLHPLWQNGSVARVHITRAAEDGDNGVLQGYIENRLLGSISLPPDMMIARRDSRWQWAGNGVE